jgi:chromate reductase
LRILAISGSLRQDSYNTRLLHALPALAPDEMDIEIFTGLDEVPHYNQDLDDRSGGPEQVRRLRSAITEADGLIVASPEYNQSIPGVLKNAIDWASRPIVNSALLGKCIVTMVVTPGRGLGRNGLADLGRVLNDCHAHVVGGPWVIMQEAENKISASTTNGDGPPTITDPFYRHVAILQLKSLKDAIEHDAGRHAAFPLQAFLEAARARAAAQAAGETPPETNSAGPAPVTAAPAATS